MWENCKYGLMRGTGLLTTGDSKRARNWKRWIQPRIGLTKAEPVLYSTQTFLIDALESEKGVFRRRHQKARTAGITPHTMIDAARFRVNEIAGI